MKTERLELITRNDEPATTAIALLAAAGIVVVIGMQPYWAMLVYWMGRP